MRLDEIKDIVCAEIDSKADHLVSLAKDILHTPETILPVPSDKLTGKFIKI